MLNIFDIIAAVITIGLGVRGFFDGLFRGAVKLIGFFLSISLLAVFSEQIISAALSVTVIPPAIAIPAAFFIVLIACSVAIHIIANLLHKLIHMTPVGFLDTMLGSVFGVLKGLFLSGLLATFISFAPEGTSLKTQYRTSLFARPLITFLSESIPYVKKAVIPIYQRFYPLPREPLKKNDDQIISPNII